MELSNFLSWFLAKISVITIKIYGLKILRLPFQHKWTKLQQISPEDGDTAEKLCLMLTLSYFNDMTGL